MSDRYENRRANNIPITTQVGFQTIIEAKIILEGARVSNISFIGSIRFLYITKIAKHPKEIDRDAKSNPDAAPAIKIFTTKPEIYPVKHCQQHKIPIGVYE
tara:strand:- start:102 stop:404 length:303 start_codon:yes stop_codon:yes gene_type:complete